ncbi:MAG: sulfatase-like hydrolase/transferase [Planctomycetota bacterium]
MTTFSRPRNWLLALTLVVACLAAWLIYRGKSDTGGARVQHILIVTLDTTRWDRMGAYGYRPGGYSPTPAFDSLGDDGRIYERAFAPAPLTLPSHASLMTGLEPAQHGVRENDGFALSVAADRSFQTLAEGLRNRGYATAAFVSAQPLDRRFGLAAGFDTYDDLSDSASRGGASNFVERSAEATTDRALAWLKEHSADAPSFMWVHYFDPHHPHRRHTGVSETWEARGASPYEGEIAYMDLHLQRLLEAYKARGQWQNTLVIVLADHGESLGQHGEPSHGYLTYDSTMRIPFAVKMPATKEGKASLPRGSASVLDVLPTVAAMVGWDPPHGQHLRGRDLRKVFTESQSHFGESMYPFRQFNWSAPRALWLADEKLIVAAGEAELYDIKKDPQETKDLAPLRPERVRFLRETMRRYRARLTSLHRKDLRMDPPVALSASAYLQAAGKSVAAEPDDLVNVTLPHPRGKMRVVAALDGLRHAIERLATEESAIAVVDLQSRVALLEASVQAGNPAALFWIARARLRLAGLARGNLVLPDSARRELLSEALNQLETLRAVRPEDPRVYNQMHLVRLASLGLGGEKAAFEAILSLFEEQQRRGLLDALAWALRGKANEWKGDFGAAIDDLKRAISLDGSRKAWHRDLKLLEAKLRDRKRRQSGG